MLPPLGLPVSKTVRQLDGRLAASSGWAVLARLAHVSHAFLHPSTRPAGWEGVRTSGHAEKRALQPVPPALLPASQKPCMEARFKCICMQWDFKPPSSPIQFEPLYTPIYSERSNSSSPANGSTERGPLSGCSHPPPGKGLKFQSNARFKGPHPPHVMPHASPAARQGKVYVFRV